MLINDPECNIYQQYQHEYRKAAGGISPALTLQLIPNMLNKYSVYLSRWGADAVISHYCLLDTPLCHTHTHTHTQSPTVCLTDAVINLHAASGFYLIWPRLAVRGHCVPIYLLHAAAGTAHGTTNYHTPTMKTVMACDDFRGLGVGLLHLFIFSLLARWIQRLR